MEGIMGFVSIIIIIFGILQIILFFKLWGMTNNISEIKELIKNYSIREKVNPVLERPDAKSVGDIKIEDLVVELKSERELRVVDITEDGKYQCKVLGAIAPAGFFDRSEIELSDKYWKK